MVESFQASLSELPEEKEVAQFVEELSSWNWAELLYLGTVVLNMNAGAF